jgi:excisionase family DNA binding protein
VKDEELHKLFSNLRSSLEASHKAQLVLLDVVEALVKTRTSNVVIREIEAEPGSEAAPFSRQALQRSERTTISVEEAGKYLGIGRAAAYLAVKNGELPSLRLGSRILVPVWALLELLAGRSATEAPERRGGHETPQAVKGT